MLKLLFGAFVGAALALNDQKGRLDVNLVADWHKVLPDTLVLETVAQRNKSAFFPLLSLYAAQLEHAEEIGDQTQDLSQFLIDKSSGFIQSPQLLEADLALDIARTAVEAHFTAYEDLAGIESVQDCEQVLDIGGKLTCDLSELYTLQGAGHGRDLSETPGLRESDRIIGTGPTAILYADLSKPESFVSWHTNLLAAALERKLAYIVRWKPPQNSTGEPVDLTGYGVKVQLKRTDYLVIDDRTTQDARINVDAPHGAIDAAIVPELGVRASNYLLGRPVEEVVDIILNFPAHLPEFAEAAGDDDKFRLPTGANFMLLDGFPLTDTAASDVYEFVNALWERDSDLTVLAEALGASKSDAHKIYREWAALQDAEHEQFERFDIRSSAVVWLNNVETDPQFGFLPAEAGELLNVERGGFASLRRNLHSLVLAMRFDDKASVASLYRLLQLVSGQAPIQLGIVPLDVTEASAKFMEAAKLGSEAALKYVVTLLGSQAGPEKALKAAQESGSSTSIRELDDPREWARKFDISDPTLFVNGVPLPANSWQVSAMLVFNQDIEYLQGLLENGELREDDTDTNLRDMLLARGHESRNRIVDPATEPAYSFWPKGAHATFKAPKKGTGDVAVVADFATAESADAVATLLELVSRGRLASVQVFPALGAPLDLVSALFTPALNPKKAAAIVRQTIEFNVGLRSAPHPAVREVAIINADKFSMMAATGPPRLIVEGREIPQEAVKLAPEVAQREAHRVAAARDLLSGRANVSPAAVAGLQAASRRESRVATPQLKPHASSEGLDDLPWVYVLLDPASERGQELASLAGFAAKLGFHVDIHFAPAPCETVPNRIYRATYNASNTPGVSFDLDEDTLYTVGIVEPPNWVVTARECPQDLDNLILNAAPGNHVTATYGLRSLLVEGHSRQPGLELQLRKSSPDHEVLGDTIVMANLGYFQLQAPRPGAYEVCTSSGSQCVPVWVGSVIPDSVILPILDGSPESETPSKLFDWTKWIPEWAQRYIPTWLEKSLSSLVALSSSSSSDFAEDPCVNIFTVASGHLYERFASIMALSVMRHARHPVKLWLIENFMSPSFKQFIPYLAERYGFDYELVTYKWPSWLRHQTEKQREIWGYKILFLDVLFPQSIHKVIFVDSDQIVRTDLKELVDVDLHGAPYGYAPMGDDRPEMEGFRFWKQGYWKKLLGGRKPYHISALYVVDLDQFRAIGAGDRLRQHYQQLSSDPSSLSNLDQDLPNNLQFQVPIHTLDRNWLWCETWCSDESLATAKTIDLCNNPLTKEPKLDRARRQIPEWTEYDEEVARLRQEFFASRVVQAATEEANSDEADAKLKPSHDEL